MQTELGHTRPRPEVEELRARITDQNKRDRIAKGLVGPDNIIEQMEADPTMSVVDPAIATQLAATDARRGAPPGGFGSETTPVVSGEDAVASNQPSGTGNAPVPFVSREGNVYGQDDIPALTQRANEQLQVLPPGVSPFARPGAAPGQAPSDGDPNRRRLERAVQAAMTSAPRLQYGQSIYSNLSDRPDLMAQAERQHQARLTAGNAAGELLQTMDRRADAGAIRDAARQQFVDQQSNVIQDASGNAFFVNPVTQQVSPVPAPVAAPGVGGPQQMQLPQDPRLLAKRSAFEGDATFLQKSLNISNEESIKMAKELKGQPRESVINKMVERLISGDFNKPQTQEELDAVWTMVANSYDKANALDRSIAPPSGSKDPLGYR